jgi:DNA polymerase I-like protein with 3'-5' exonuclease and polymerase domains
MDGACQAVAKLEGDRDATLADLAHRLGRSSVSMELIRSNRSLVQLFMQEGLESVLKQHSDNRGAVSFEAHWMRRHDHWLPKLVSRATQLHDAANKFLVGFILNYAHAGRLHGSINQYRGEDGGTRSHRFSYSDPPLQQMPARDAELAALIRGVFLPEAGEVWGAADYSQQEYRLIVHFAHLLGCRKADEAVDLYISDPSTDFHILVSEWTGLERKPAKDTNFAKAFGAGIPKFALMIGKSPSEAKDIYEQYDRELPFVKELAKKCQVVAEKRGYIRLLDGARSHFDMWEPTWREDGEAYSGPRPLAQARELWGQQRRLKRAFGHKAMNRLIQGSAARQTKMAMRDCWRAGHVPLIQMHDELGFSIPSLSVAQEVQGLMRNTVKLSVPMKVDCELGCNWGEATAKVEKVSPDEFQVMARRSGGRNKSTDGPRHV